MARQKVAILIQSFFCGSHCILSNICLCSELYLIFQFSSVQLLSRVRLFEPDGLQHARPPCPSPAPGAYSDSCSSSRWCHPIISSSVVPFSCLQSFPASGSFQTSQFFTSGGQSIGISASSGGIFSFTSLKKLTERLVLSCIECVEIKLKSSYQLLI